MSDKFAHDCPALTEAVQEAYDRNMDALRDDIAALVKNDVDTAHAFDQLAISLSTEADILSFFVETYFDRELGRVTAETSVEDVSPAPFFNIPTSTSLN